MTANAVPGYFATRDDLITALIADVYGELADAVEAARDMHPPEAAAAERLAWACAFRDWALLHREGFRLIYGGYRPPAAAGQLRPNIDSARA